MVFANIEYLFLLLLLIPYIVWYILKRKKTEATLQISDARVYAHTPKSYKNYLLHAPFILRVIALALIIVVLARPQSTNKWQNSEIEGIDIMLAIDVSTSMLAEDLKPNRLEAAKDVAAEFINGRPNDNIGDWWINKQTELNDTFTKSNVDSVSVRTDQDYVKALLNLFAKRN